MDEVLFNELSAVLWSKADRKDPSRAHLFFYHLLDSGAVALRLWEKSLPESIRREVAKLLHLEPQEAGKVVAYWCALHDIGKASPVFQEKLKMQAKKAEQKGFSFPKGLNQQIYHSRISGRFLRDKKLVPQQVDIAISGHHGAWNCDYDFSNYCYGGSEWQVFREGAQEKIQAILGVTEKVVKDFPDGEYSNVFTCWLSGFITVVDWIASNEDLFSYVSELRDLQTYFQDALQNADKALYRLGWVGWRARGELVSFKQMFPHIDKPRPIQTKICALYDQIDPREPFLAVIEAPTGIGKTEIAYFLADRWNQQNGGSGIYIAMPTQATSNQMYERSIKILKDRYPTDLIPLVLAHGQAAWNENVNAIRLKEIGEDSMQAVVAAEWFQNNRKRSLLTPFGVGTVDQVFLSILQTNHFFVRLFGLKNKVVIFDEIHAYDCYMQELFIRLLRWLRSLGTAVVVLSATLPEEFRRQIVGVYCGEGSEVPGNQDYPRISLAIPGKGVQTFGLLDCIPKDSERILHLNWAKETDLVAVLKERLQEGGCAAVICNTVRKAQALYGILDAIVSKEDFLLFHARFPQAWRQEKERQVLMKFGKDKEGQLNFSGQDANPYRPTRSIVIATQVIEQSLDLDFDLLISEVAPVDLILQRAGRLHRHKRARPNQLKQAELILLQPPEKENGLPDFESSSFIYPQSILLKSYLLLKPIQELDTIRQTRCLIEQVYGKDQSAFEDPGLASQLQQLEQKEREKERQTRQRAGPVMIAQPDYENLLYTQNLDLKDDEDPAVHRSYQALTRDTDGLSLSLLCLHRRDGLLYLDPDCQQPVNLADLETDYGLLKKVLGQSLSINQMGVVNHLLNCAMLERVEKVPALRHHLIMAFQEGVFETDQYRFKLTYDLGLETEKK